VGLGDQAAKQILKELEAELERLKEVAKDLLEEEFGPARGKGKGYGRESAGQVEAHLRDIVRRKGPRAGKAQVVLDAIQGVRKRISDLHKSRGTTGTPPLTKFSGDGESKGSGGSTTPKSFAGKIGRGMWVAGKFAVASGIGFLLSWLLGKIIQEQQQEGMKRQVNELQPKVEADLRRGKESVLRRLAAGKRAYATMRYSVTVQDHHMGPDAGWSSTAPKVDYLGMEITDQPVATPDGTWKEVGKDRDNFVAPGAMSETTFYKVSAEVTFTPEEIERYRQLIGDVEWYERAAQWARSKESLHSTEEWMQHRANAYAARVKLDEALAE
jgi:hypothetical protein